MTAAAVVDVAGVLAERMGSAVRRARARVRRVARWRRRHPVLFLGAATTVLTVVWVLCGNVVAALADATSNPLITTLELTDLEGVPLVNYSILPLDRGNLLDSDKMVVGVLTDFVWTGHVAMVAATAQALGWVLDFAWLGWLLTPFTTLATSIGDALGRFSWAPFALLVAGAVGGFLIFVGRTAAGAADLAVSALCFALSTTILANPVAGVVGDDGTGSDGAIGVVQGYGEELAVAVFEDLDVELRGAVDEGELLADGVPALLVSILVTIPAQEVAFGHRLEDGCEAAYYDAMRASPPMGGGDDVRKAVSDCDPVAKVFAESPTSWQTMTAVVSSIGASTIAVFAWSLIVLLAGCAVGAATAGIRTMVWLQVAMLPSLGRRQVAKAIADLATSTIAFVIVLVVLAAGFGVVFRVVESLTAAHVPFVMQMGVLSILTLAAAIAAVTMLHRLKKQGRSLLSSFTGAGRGADRGSAPNAKAVTDLALNAAQLTPAAPVATAIQVAQTATGPAAEGAPAVAPEPVEGTRTIITATAPDAHPAAPAPSAPSASPASDRSPARSGEGERVDRAASARPPAHAVAGPTPDPGRFAQRSRESRELTDAIRALTRAFESGEDDRRRDAAERVRALDTVRTAPAPIGGGAGARTGDARPPSARMALALAIAQGRAS